MNIIASCFLAVLWQLCHCLQPHVLVLLCTINSTVMVQSLVTALPPYSRKFSWGPYFILFILSLSEWKFNTRNVCYDGCVFLCKMDWTKIKHTNQLEIAQNEIWTPQKFPSIWYMVQDSIPHRMVYDSIPHCMGRCGLTGCPCFAWCDFKPLMTCSKFHTVSRASTRGLVYSGRMKTWTRNVWPTTAVHCTVTGNCMAVPSMTAVLCHCLQPHEMRSLYSVLLVTTVQGTVTGYYLTASALGRAINSFMYLWQLQWYSHCLLPGLYVVGIN